MDGITPEQLREMAAKMEVESEQAFEVVTPPANIRHIEVDGIALDIDVRRIKDYRTLSLIAKVEGGDMFAAIQLFDFLLGDQRDKAVKAMTDESDYCDAEAFMGLCSKVLEAAGAKN